jgi:hypothetical protein
MVYNYPYNCVDYFIVGGNSRVRAVEFLYDTLALSI